MEGTLLLKLGLLCHSSGPAMFGVVPALPRCLCWSECCSERGQGLVHLMDYSR